MGESGGTGEIDTREVVRDLINWMDYTDAGWRDLEPGARRDLLARARLYFEQVARRHHLDADALQVGRGACGAPAVPGLSCARAQERAGERQRRDEAGHAGTLISWMRREPPARRAVGLAQGDR